MRSACALVALLVVALGCSSGEETPAPPVIDSGVDTREPAIDSAIDTSSEVAPADDSGSGDTGTEAGDADSAIDECTPTDVSRCPASTEPECRTPRCAAGKCAYDDLAAGTPLTAAKQTAGDCKVQVCDGAGAVRADDADDPPPGTPCTGRICEMGVARVVDRPLGTTCPAGVCSHGSCVASLCVDDKKNGDETDLDCGGSCAPCAIGKVCAAGRDCVTGVCSSGVCAAPSCTDGVKNGSETDLDCGSTCAKCADSKTCAASVDCVSAVCTGGVCMSPACTDTKKNGSETDVDCGGSSCPVCAIGAGCAVAGDCVSGVCAAAKCASPSCTDGVKNGVETGTDCGGSCPACAVGGGCKVHGDCTTGYCVAGTCTAASCTDGVKNGAETDLDCGGTCGPCARTKACALNSDCVTGSCHAGRCGYAYFDFEAGRTHETEIAPIATASVDFDGDGRLDVLKLETAATSGAIAIVKNLGGHAFAPERGYSVVAQPQAFAIADMNLDGRPDVVSISQGKYGESWTAVLSVHRNNGAGGLTTAWTTPLSDPPIALAVGDIDGDGIPDAIVSGVSQIGVFRGVTGGTFTRVATMGLSATAVALADLDGDGDLDLVLNKQYDSSPLVTYLNTSGTFGDPKSYFGDGGIKTLLIADVDRDGRQDILTLGSYLMIHRNRGDRTFAYSNVAGLPGGTYATPILADVDLNGAVDVVFGATGNGVQLLLGKGDGTFTKSSVATDHYFNQLMVGDFDDDCRPDLVWVDQYGMLDALYNRGRAKWTEAPRSEGAGGGDGVAVAEVTGDGNVDIVCTSRGYPEADRWTVWPSLGGGAWGTPTMASYPGTAREMRTGDVNGDGRTDFLQEGALSGFRIIAGKAGGGTAAPVSVPATCHSAFGFELADLNRDGKLDIVAACWDGISVLMGNGDGTFGAEVVYGDIVYKTTLTAFTPHDLAVVDIDGDGDLDLVTPENSFRRVSIWLNNGAGVFPSFVGLPMAQNSEQVAVGDLDGDGLPEIVVATPAIQSVAIFRNLGAVKFSGPTSLFVGRGISDLAIGDMDGDGWLDLVTSHSHGAMYVFRGRGGVAFDAPMGWTSTYARTDLGGQRVRFVLRDINADGKLDIVTGGGFTTVLRNVSGTAPLLCGTCGDGVVSETEVCDDGALASGDGCSAKCQFESGFSCSGSPSACKGICGDGLVRTGEVCDDGNPTGGDGCSATCAIESGWTCVPPSGATPSVCSATCGDSIVVGPELCDDGNLVDGDTCPSTCRREMWGRRFGDAKGQGIGQVAVHPSGDAIVVGTFEGKLDVGTSSLTSASRDAFVARISSTGAPLWAAQPLAGVVSSTSNGQSWGNSVAVDPAGNAYIAGQFFSNVNVTSGGSWSASGYAGYLAKYSSSGALLWVKRFAGSGRIIVHAVAADSSGNVVVGGEFDTTIDIDGTVHTSAGQNDIFLAKLDGSGARIWSQRFGDAARWQSIESLSIDPFGNIYAGGTYSGTINFGAGAHSVYDASDGFVAKFDPAGTALWSRAYGVNNNYEHITSVAALADGGVVAGGAFSWLWLGTTEYKRNDTYDAFIVALNSDGSYRFSKVWSAPDAQWVTSLSSVGTTIAVGGHFADTLDFGDGPKSNANFVLKMTTTGTYFWSQTYKQAGGSVMLEPGGDLYVGGSMSGTISVGRDTLTSAGAGDALLMRLAK